MAPIREYFKLTLFKKQVYVGLMEILKDRQYYYHSSVGTDYSHLTEEGIEVLVEYLQVMAPTMLKKDREELETLAKSLVWDGLKK